nr:immunoglobulin light chain junction region [Macaca mulatta]
DYYCALYLGSGISVF